MVEAAPAKVYVGHLGVLTPHPMRGMGVHIAGVAGSQNCLFVVFRLLSSQVAQRVTACIMYTMLLNVVV